MSNTKSIDFESTNSQYVYAADSNALDLSGNFSIEMWIKPETIAATCGLLIKGDSFESNTPAYDMLLWSDGSIMGRICTGTSFMYSRTVASVIATGSWYHIAITWVAGTSNPIKIYINGSEASYASQGTGLNSFNTNAQPLYIGASKYNGSVYSFYDGLMDEVRVWNVTRTATQINDNKSVVLNGNETGLVGYWRFENNLSDTTANNNTLTAVHSPVYSTDVPFGGAGNTANFFQFF